MWEGTRKCGKDVAGGTGVGQEDHTWVEMEVQRGSEHAVGAECRASLTLR